MHKLLVFTGVLAVATVVYGSEEGPDYSHGLQIIGKVLRHFINSQPEDFQISEGVHLVHTASPNDATGRAADDNTFFGTIDNYLQTHEIIIKFTELMPNGQDFGRSFKDAVNGVNSADVGNEKNSIIFFEKEMKIS
ncbi:hypothetical protein ILUMI_00325 [Ignelater luminosus]|uniref:Uncharacterized protein n=1 Tax=Ignelater luminosus TaxID=2038154 RepID=A0A8K0DMI4_IGNLU|nr:hypothetical protein ILUMI_00325 [Ignelater luminosus]